MSKQVLSVSDFSMIMHFVNSEVDRMECRDEAWGCDEEKKIREQERLDKERETRLQSSFYLQLKHLQNALINLNIEVETPDVELRVQELEIKKQTPWQIEMYAEKPIKFEPPAWEELTEMVEAIKSSKKEVDIKDVLHFNNGNIIHTIYFVKSEDVFSIELTDNDEVNETFELSEVGYVLAVNKARMIFLGDENNE